MQAVISLYSSTHDYRKLSSYYQMIIKYSENELFIMWLIAEPIRNNILLYHMTKNTQKA